MGTIGVRLADGTVYTFPVRRLPRHWKSWVMQRVPYGTSFLGCAWIIERATVRAERRG